MYHIFLLFNYNGKTNFVSTQHGYLKKNKKLEHHQISRTLVDMNSFAVSSKMLTVTKFS